MRLISKKTVLWKEYKDFSSLFELKGKVQKVYIASAYADPDTIKLIFKDASRCGFDNRGAQFTAFIDRAASQALQGQDHHEEYPKLNKTIKRKIGSNNIQSSGIRLVGDNLFHSKIIYIKTTQVEYLVVGSMNATQNGINKDENEEVIIFSNNPSKQVIDDTLKYFSYLASDSVSSSVNEQKAKPRTVTLRDFFMDGNLYVKYSPANLFSFTLNLPENFREATAKIHPLLDAETKNSLSMLKFCNKETTDKMSDNNQLVQTKLRWTDYCLETLHGYWAPSFFSEQIKNLLTRREGIKCKEIERAKLLSDPNVEAEIFNFFDSLEKSINQQQGTWCAAEAKTRWEKWRNERLNRLFTSDNKLNKDFALRLSHGVQHTPCIDFFNDAEHADLFIDSVIDFITFNMDRKGVKNKFIQLLKKMNIRIETKDDLLNAIRSTDNESLIQQLRQLD